MKIVWQAKAWYLAADWLALAEDVFDSLAVTFAGLCYKANQRAFLAQKKADSDGACR